MRQNLPVVRAHERMDYKRCVKKWYWRWRKGLVPRAIRFGALEMGTWFHEAFAAWYLRDLKRGGNLAELYVAQAEHAMRQAQASGAPEHALDEAEKLLVLGEAMAVAYQDKYGNDPDIYVVGAEIPLEFTISDQKGHTIAVHRLKPDLVFMDSLGDFWLMEHKTAATIRTEHLAINDQARPYGVMAEGALRKIGLIRGKQSVKGILYNFLRKVLPDERPTNDQGYYLNKNGTVSKRQPPPNFVRHPVTLTKAAKIISLHRIRAETVTITRMTLALRSKEIDPLALPKTPHWSCSKNCDFFAMCVAEENGSDIRDMERTMFRRENPYQYGDSTSEHVGFEMG